MHRIRYNILTMMLSWILCKKITKLGNICTVLCKIEFNTKNYVAVSKTHSGPFLIAACVFEGSQSEDGNLMCDFITVSYKFRQNASIKGQEMFMKLLKQATTVQDGRHILPHFTDVFMLEK